LAQKQSQRLILATQPLAHIGLLLILNVRRCQTVLAKMLKGS